MIYRIVPLFLLAIACQSDPKEEKNIDIPIKSTEIKNKRTINELVTKVKKLESEPINDEVISKLMKLYEEIIKTYPKDSLSFEYYYKLSVYYSQNNKELKSREVSESLLKNCPKGFDDNKKKVVLDLLIASYDLDENRNIPKIKSLYEQLLALSINSKEDIETYRNRMENLSIPLENILNNTK